MLGFNHFKLDMKVSMQFNSNTKYYYYCYIIIITNNKPMASMVPKVPNVAMVFTVLKITVEPKLLMVPKVLWRLRCYAA